MLNQNVMPLLTLKCLVSFDYVTKLTQWVGGENNINFSLNPSQHPIYHRETLPDNVSLRNTSQYGRKNVVMLKLEGYSHQDLITHA